MSTVASSTLPLPGPPVLGKEDKKDPVASVEPVRLYSFLCHPASVYQAAMVTRLLTKADPHHFMLRQIDDAETMKYNTRYSYADETYLWFATRLGLSDVEDILSKWNEHNSFEIHQCCITLVEYF